MTLSHEQRLKNALADQHRKCFDQDKRTLKQEYAEYIDCPVCGSADKVLFFEKDWFTFSKCRNCSMVYLNPRLNDRATYEFYNSEWNSVYNEKKFDTITPSTILDDKINHENLQRIIRHRGSAQGRLLEIGSAKGFFLRKAKEAGFAIHGLELNEKNFLKTRKEFGETVLNVDLFQANFSDEMFDVIYMRDVFEHVPNPKAMLKELNRIAKKGCLLYIEVPNIEGIIYKLVKERHVCIFGFEHLNYWSAATLEKILRSSGFNVSKVIYSSLDFSVRELLRCFFVPAFTTLYPKRTPRIIGMLSRLLYYVMTLFLPLRYLDAIITPSLADRLGRGSVVKVFAEKMDGSFGISNEKG